MTTIVDERAVRQADKHEQITHHVGACSLCVPAVHPIAQGSNPLDLKLFQHLHPVYCSGLFISSETSGDLLFINCVPINNIHHYYANAIFNQVV